MDANNLYGKANAFLVQNVVFELLRWILNFQLYRGKNPCGNEKYYVLLGKAASPLVSMLEELRHTIVPYNIHVDILFTGMNLFSYLRYLGYGVIGTFKENRIL